MVGFVWFFLHLWKRIRSETKRSPSSLSPISSEPPLPLSASVFCVSHEELGILKLSSGSRGGVREPRVQTVPHTVFEPVAFFLSMSVDDDDDDDDEFSDRLFVKWDWTVTGFSSAALFVWGQVQTFLFCAMQCSCE